MSKEYIGTLSGDWRLERLNNVANLYGRIGWQGLTADEYQDEGPWLVTGTDFQDGRVNWDSCVHISDKRWEEAWQIKLQPGDLLITKDGTVGKLAIVEDMPGNASLNSGVMRIVPLNDTDYSVKYLYYVLQTDVFTEWFKDINAGASTIQHLFQKDFKHFVFPLPSLAEQNVISARLDESCGRLDKAIANLETQLKTLTCYRSSVIHEAVTRGLDSTASTKPSGIGWIGNIPTGWNLTKLQQIAYLRARLGWKGLKADEYVEEGYPLFSAFNIQNNMLVQAECDYINEQRYKESPEIMLSEGDVLLVKDGAGYGKHAYVQSLERPSTVNGSLAVLTPKNVVEGRYLHYYFDSEVFKHQARMLMTGMGVPHLTQHFLKNILLPLPPKQDQIDIADYLDARTAAIDAVLETKRKQLDILKRRRQSLIYEYVTGKRRVTEEA